MLWQRHCRARYAATATSAVGTCAVGGRDTLVPSRWPKQENVATDDKLWRTPAGGFQAHGGMHALGSGLLRGRARSETVNSAG
jgi:hypothetical protein